MAKKIIGIHGLGNKPRSDVLYGEWKAAMLEGLKVNCDCDVQSLNFQGAFWADLVHEPLLNEADASRDAYREAKPGELKTYEDGILDRVRQELLDVGGDLLDWFRKKVAWDFLTNKVLEEFLEDLHLYYEDDDMRGKMKKRLKDCIKECEGDDIVLVAHSMGSIIAYDVLRELSQEDENSSRITHFITIGSPLGMPYVKNKIDKNGSSLRTPTIVNRWTNMADRRDPVAIDEHLGDEYSTNVRGIKVQDDVVHNDWASKTSEIQLHHKSYGYLRTPEFSHLLKEFI